MIMVKNVIFKLQESKNAPGKWEPNSLISQICFKLCKTDAKQGLLPNPINGLRPSAHSRTGIQNAPLYF